MDSRVLNKKGASMLEVTAILFIIGVIFSMVIPNYIGRINNAKYEKTVNELTSITQASVNYYVSNGAWPTAISQLSPQFLTYAVVFSPFGTNYQMTCAHNLVTASVLIPSGIAQKNPEEQLLEINNQGGQDQIKVSKTVQNDFTSRLNYDLKYIY